MNLLFLTIPLILSLLTATIQADQTSHNVSKTTFSNGLKLLTKKETGRQVVAIVAIARLDPADEVRSPGIGQLLARSLFSGTKTLSNRKLAELCDDVGGQFSINWELDYLEVYISTISSQTHSALELLAAVLLEHRIDNQSFDRAIRDLSADTEEGNKNAFRSAYDKIRTLLYSNSPYKVTMLPSEDIVRKTNLDDLRRYADKWLTPANLTICVAGDINTTQVFESTRLWFGSKKVSAAPTVAKIMDEAGRMTPAEVIERDTKAAYVMAGTLASGISSQRYPADLVVSTILGGGKASRMFQIIREDQGLAYDLGVFYPPLINQSHLIAYVLSPSSTEEISADLVSRPIVELTRSTLDFVVETLKNKPVTKEELERAKGYIIGSYAQKRERLKDRAKYLAWYEAIGLGWQYDFKFPQMINSVTLDDALTSAQRLFSRTAMVVVLPAK